MTRKLISTLPFLALAPVFLFAAGGCADAPSAPPELATVAAAEKPLAGTSDEKLAELHRQYDWMGQYHTDGLDFVLADLKKIPKQSRTKAAVCARVASAVRRFNKLRRGTALGNDALPRAFVEGACPDEQSLGQSFSVSVAGRGTAVPLASTLAQSYLDQMMNLAYANLSEADFYAAVDAIDKAAVAHLSARDAGAIVGVGSVAISSAQYWTTNYNEWDSYMETVTPPANSSSMQGTGYARGLSFAAGSVANPTISPILRGVAKILGADALGAGRVVANAWLMALPIGWDAAAASATWSSALVIAAML